jgi:hypothetical protein
MAANRLPQSTPASQDSAIFANQLHVDISLQVMTSAMIQFFYGHDQSVFTTRKVRIQ